MTVGVRAGTTAAHGTNSVAPPYPAGVGPTDLVLLGIVVKPTSVGITVPPDFNFLQNVAGGIGTFGADTGPVKIAVHYRIAETALSGTVSVGLSTDTNQSASAGMVCFTKTAAVWDLSQFAIGEHRVHDSSWITTGERRTVTPTYKYSSYNGASGGTVVAAAENATLVGGTGTSTYQTGGQHGNCGRYSGLRFLNTTIGSITSGKLYWTGWIRIQTVPPTTDIWLTRFLDATVTGVSGLGLSTAGKWILRSGTGTTQDTSAITPSLNTWYAVFYEVDVDADTQQASIYSAAGTLLETLTGAGGTATITDHREGGQGDTGSVIDYDDTALSNSPIELTGFTPNNLDLATGDWLLAVNGGASDAPSFSSRALAVPGVTFDTVSVHQGSGTALGNDSMIQNWCAQVTAGASGAPSASAALSAAQSGASIFVRVRELDQAVSQHWSRRTAVQHTRARRARYG